MSFEGRLKEVILEILRRAGSAGLTRTQLVKLCFLVDRFAVEKLGQPITDVHYAMYFYGPYSPAIIDVAREMELEQLLVKHTGISFATGELYYVYRLGDIGDEIQPQSVLGEKEKAVIDDVVEKYGHISLRQLLDFVYSLPEVKRAKLGETIVLGEGLL